MKSPREVANGRQVCDLNFLLAFLSLKSLAIFSFLIDIFLGEIPIVLIG